MFDNEDNMVSTHVVPIITELKNIDADDKRLSQENLDDTLILANTAYCRFTTKITRCNS